MFFKKNVCHLLHCQVAAYQGLLSLKTSYVRFSGISPSVDTPYIVLLSTLSNWDVHHNIHPVMICQTQLPIASPFTEGP